jgi:flagellar hook-basal body protein
MMGSLFSSISGLKNDTTWMNTIGNNISNVSTVGYKAQRVTFKEQISQMLGSASAANFSANIGGINPEQQGLGSVLGSIDTIMTQGAIQTTGNPLDVAISGDGFFAVNQGSARYYTRAGNFYQDNLGNVVTSDGSIVQGWTGGLQRTIAADAGSATDNPALQIRAATYKLDTNDVGKIGNITIPKDMTMTAQATNFIQMVGNLDSMTPLNNYCATDPVALGVATALPSNYSPDEAPSLGNSAVMIGDVNIGSLPGAAAPGTDFYFTTTPGAAGGNAITPDHTATITCYDSLGNPRSITVWFFQHGCDTAVPDANSFRPVWDWYAFDTTYVKGSAVYTGTPGYQNCLGGTNIDYGSAAAVPAVPPNQQTFSPIWFNQDGSLASDGGVWDLNGVAGFGRQVDSWTDPNTNIIHYGPQLTLRELNAAQGIDPDGAISPWKVTLDFGTPNSWDKATGAVAGLLSVNTPVPLLTGNTQIDPGAPGLRDGLTGDVTGTYQTIGGIQTYVPNSSAYAKQQDGYGSGALSSLSVDSTGGMVGQFTNGKSIKIAQMSIATFANEQGLAKVGDSMYAVTGDSGIARMGTAGSAGAGTTTGGALEASNVDLSVELTNMIIAQRGYEANARIITTSAAMLDTLVNIGR